jgi:8-oxo-dGTP diphosphatase
MEQNQITIVVALITNVNREILLAKRHQPDNPQIHGKWEFPGGGIDFGEEPEQALLREVKEETGLDVKIKRLLPKIYSNLWNWPEGKRQVIILSYECKTISGELDSSDEEIGELKYFKPEDVDYQNSLPKTKELIDLLDS